ncbi:hypothetical protein FLL45_13200 [Aliikangiella marina]|uniref:RDD domain-containing protein n=1 Tax=Aliikangiella marina TaxID=1712262 RepID=A0A545T9C5_9GAMM|nr:RDD family protein [Aliikangiella marina]TQV73820.1 hypothetical protein FLL45_13200 [Aliikangiella marina]
MNASFCLNCGASLSQANTPYQPPTSQAQPPMAAGFVYGGFWKRFFAYFIDGIIFNFTFFMIAIWGFGAAASLNDPFAMSSSVGLIYLFYYLSWWMYYALQESSNAQATIGKRALGIKVVDMNGHALSFAHAAGRQAAGAITAFTLLIGYLLAAFTKRKQALHDLIAGTVIVNNNFGPNQIVEVNQNPPAGMSVGGIIAVVGLVLIIPIGGIIAMVSVPAYHDYTTRAKVASATSRAQQAQAAISIYALDTGYWPRNFEQAKISSDDMRTSDYYILLEPEGVLSLNFESPESLAGSQLLFIPELDNDGGYDWRCQPVRLESRYLPSVCQNN